MDVTTVISHSKSGPFGFTVASNKISIRLFKEQFHVNALTNWSNRQFHPQPKHVGFPLNCSFYSNNLFPLSSKPTRKRVNLLPSPKCSISSKTSLESHHDRILKCFGDLSFDSIKATILQFTLIDIVKWSGLLSIIIAATKWTFNMLFSPFFWMYFRWTWLFWPWMVSIMLAVYGLYCFRKHLLGEAKIFEQLGIVTSVFTWLTLVPPAYFNGYLEGWPFVFFFSYHYFFFFNVSIRKRLYGDYYACTHDPKWDVNLPVWHRLLFSVGVMVTHWFAAFEGLELHRIPEGWRNLGIWALIMLTLLMQHSATLYLAEHSDKVVVPTDVVQFGPYRWIRHPIYSSTMLLFVTYCLALRAPLSLMIVLAVCLLYYRQKAELEETLMIEAFGQSYTEYASKVRYKFIPFVY